MRLLGRNQRLVSLAIVNGLILTHLFVYYTLDDRRLGGVDFHGLPTLLVGGIVDGGTIFVALAVLATLLFGRLFCGWGCHFALYQDLLIRLLARVGLSPPFRRGRLEHVLPPILLFFTFAFPIIVWLHRHGLPSNVRVDFAHGELWGALPGVRGVLLILAFDVALLTVIFGGRAFCRFLCPYGYALKWCHALSPMRVVRRGSCDQCGTCARLCPTGVQVTSELDRYGVVRDLNCVNCGDCVGACPSKALALRPTRQAFGMGYRDAVVGMAQPFWADFILVASTAAGLLLYRGRNYGDFLSAAMGLTAGVALVVSIRPSVFIAPRWLQISKLRVQLWGALIGCYVLLGLLTQGLGQRALHQVMERFDAGDYKAVQRVADRAARISRATRAFTFYMDDFTSRFQRESEMIFLRGGELIESSNWVDAERCYRTTLAADPSRAQAWGNLGTTLYMQNRFDEAAPCYLRVLETDPTDAIALYHLAMTRIHQRQFDVASDLVEKILSDDGDGTCYRLISQNPEFAVLEQFERYRQAMALYRTVKLSGP